MKWLDKLINSPVLHPILVSTYPILALWLANFSETDAVVVIRPIVVSALAGFLLFIVLKIIQKNSNKAGLQTTLILVLYYSYGHIYNIIENKVVDGIIIGRHRVLIGLWVVILLIGFWLIIKYGATSSNLNRIINFAATVLVIFVVGQIIITQAKSITGTTNTNLIDTLDQSEKVQPNIKGKDNLPDVYYIILDGYARDDVMRHDFNFDNSSFLKQLVDLGFVIPQCTHSNYAYTMFSMPSSLNMNYLDKLGLTTDPNSGIISFPKLIYLRNSLARKNFTTLGYKFITFQSVYNWVNIPDADMYIKDNNVSEFMRNLLEIGDFDEILNQTTVLRAFIEYDKLSQSISRSFPFIQQYLTLYQNWIEGFSPTSNPWRNKYNLLKYSLDQLPGLVNMPDNKFIYLHLMAPHNPYVFAPDGDFKAEHNEKNGYTNQVAYLDNKILQIVKFILSNSKTKPIIILQGDHGWGNNPDTRTNILNAYYLPDGGNKLIYPQISPVNTFRIIFNYYFGGNYKLLPDVSYYSSDPRHYDFQSVPNSCSDMKLSP